MLRLAPRVAVALLTCLLGVSAVSLWKGTGGSCRGSEVAPTFASDIAEQEIREILRQYDIAQTEHDASFFERVESDDFVLTLSGGRTMTRAKDIAAMMASPKDARYTTDDIRVRFYGDAAIVTGRMTAIHTETQGSYGPRWRWIDLFLKRDGRWQIISTTQVD